MKYSPEAYWSTWQSQPCRYAETRAGPR